ncbi:hypothetical protein NDU88_002613 [Pleurodeles waltl]|uniref:Uncharacterized protein n=1 Tax=Pleurodeles waltl TaxID=8319 RepID=A0AAV7NE80_PLEWA|nr:hypothetical protein NDU88_002613 [Pleurodeles waltl]
MWSVLWCPSRYQWRQDENYRQRQEDSDQRGAGSISGALHDELADAIKDSFPFNIGSVDSIRTVGETLKVYIRGINIAKHARVLQSIPGRLYFLEKELAQLEREHLRTSDSQILGRIRIKLVEFQDMALTEVQHMGKYATSRIYGEGERPGAVLANLVCPNREKDTIMVVQAEDGSEITDPEHIANRFCVYYEALYTSKIAPNPEAALDYLLHIELPWLKAADRESLMAPLSLEEMIRAEGKAPGPDGLTPNERGPIVNQPLALSGRFVAYLVMAVHTRNV